MKVFFIVLLVLSGCSAPQSPPQATGPWHALNAGQWQPTAAEQQYIAGMPH